MKVETYIEKIKEGREWDEETIERFNRALHKEKILHPALSLRFNSLSSEFDIILSTGIYENQKKAAIYERSIQNVDDIILLCKRASDKYRAKEEFEKFRAKGGDKM